MDAFKKMNKTQKRKRDLNLSQKSENRNTKWQLKGRQSSDDYDDNDDNDDDNGDDDDNLNSDDKSRCS